MKKLISIAVAGALIVGCNQQQAKEEPAKAAKATTEQAAKTDAKATEFANEMEKVSYAIGAFQGSRMKDSGNEFEELGINLELLKKGFVEGVDGKSTMSQEEIQTLLTSYQQKLQAQAKEKQEKASAEAKATGLAFLETNSKKDGVKVTESGLQYEVVQKGDGKTFPVAVDRVKVHYVGTLIDGAEFDSSVKRGQPAEFALNGVIKGWTEGLQLMSKGSKFRFYIPSELAYGERQLPTIPANSVLIFDVELLDIFPAAKEEEKKES